MSFHSAPRFTLPESQGKQRGGEKKSTYRNMVLLAVAFPPPPTFLCLQPLRLALDKAGPAVLQWLGSGAPGAFKALSDPAFAAASPAAPARPPGMVPACPDSREKPGRCSQTRQALVFKSKQAAGSGFRSAAWNFCLCRSGVN